MEGFEIVDPVAVCIFLDEESALVNGNGFRDILCRDSFGKMSGFFQPDKIVEVTRKAVCLGPFLPGRNTHGRQSLSPKRCGSDSLPAVLRSGTRPRLPTPRYHSGRE